MALSPDSVSGDSELKRLESWKEIAAFLNRSVTTVQRWERDEGLPVHRHQHDSLGSVYAFKHELEAWRALRAMPAANGNGAALGAAAESESDQAALTTERRAAGRATESSPSNVSILASTRYRGARASWILGALVVIGITAVVTLWVRATPTIPSETRLQILTPRATLDDGFAISPDGRFVVFQAMVEGRSQLWLRPLQSETAHPLIGTEGAWYVPFWSPDSRSIGFFTIDQKLKRIDLPDGPVRALADAPNARGGSWSRTGTILFGSSTGPLYRVPADGGPKAEATGLLPRQTNHRFPHYLPDGDHFLLFAFGTPETRGVYLGSLKSQQLRRLMDADSAAQFVPPAHMLFARQGALWAQRVDPRRFEAIGDPVLVAPRVQMSPTTPGLTYFSSTTGAVAYRADAGERQLLWFNRSGHEIATLGEPDMTEPGAFRLSPDGGTLAIRRTVSGNTDIWVMDAARGVPQRVTSHSAVEWVADFSQDGNRIVFGSDRAAGISDLYEKPIDGVGTETLLLESSEQKAPVDWSADGRYILYTSQSPKSGIDLWVLPLFGDRKPWAVVQTPFADGHAFSGAEFSSDGRWLAYQSNETGQNEIYVQPFPGPATKVRISSRGGTNPRWRQDGRELFYTAFDRRVMAVRLSFNDYKLRHEEPVALFVIPPPPEPIPTYAVSPDGERFLVNTLVGDNSTITIILNWKAPER
jgi:Tol biopolymer transport system component